MKGLFNEEISEMAERPLGKYKSFRLWNNYHKADNKDKCCKTCVHSIKQWGNTKHYYKCLLQGISDSESSDIRAGYICNKHKEKKTE